MTTIRIDNKRRLKLDDKTENSDFQTCVFMEFQVAVLPRCAGIPDFFLPVNFLAPRNAWPAPPASNLSYGCRASGGRSSRHNGPAQFSMRVGSVSPTVGNLCGLNTTGRVQPARPENPAWLSRDRKSTRLNSSHTVISYAVFCLKKKKKKR